MPAPQPASDAGPAFDAGLFSPDALHDLSLLALLMAHGADADLDPRELDTLAERLLGLHPSLSGDDVLEVFNRAARAYAEAKVTSTEGVAERLGGLLDETARRRAFALLRAVAEADGVLHVMESALLRHVAQTWEISPAFVPEAGDLGSPEGA
jgi:uncharacterized tellurite resistance protein B-like protein